MFKVDYSYDDGNQQHSFENEYRADDFQYVLWQIREDVEENGLKFDDAVVYAIDEATNDEIFVCEAVIDDGVVRFCNDDGTSFQW